jgi:integrase
MTKIRLQFVHQFRDRHGKTRRYFRRPGFKRIPLPGLPGSDEFMDAYKAALAGDTAPKAEIGAARTIPGTVAAAVVSYFNSAAFQLLAAETRRTRRNILERFRAEHGDKRIALLHRTAIDRMVAAKAKTPAAARNFLKTLRALMVHVIAQGMRADDPTAGIKMPKQRKGGYTPWGDEHIAQYRERHAIGSRARLALELLLNIGPRRSDVVRLGRQHLRDGEFAFRTQKTKVLIEGVRLLPELAEALDAMPGGDLTFLTTEFGKPFTAAGFGNWFRDRCNEAGIPNGYSAHGLRKASATRLVDHGATAHQLMAVFGWTTIGEAERYTRAANKKKLARSAGELVRTGTSSGKPS